MTLVDRLNPLSVVKALVVFALFTFLFHFAWEILQAPLFANMPARHHWQATMVCLKATFGDVEIALLCFAVAALWDQNCRWYITPNAGALASYFGTGVLITVAFEWYAVHKTSRWAYSDLMPIIPILKVGLAPVMQWIFLPAAVLFFLQRHRVKRSSVQ